MSRTSEEQFPALSARIPDAEARALFTWPFLRASEVFDELVDAASAELLRRAGAWPVAPGTAPAALVAARGWAPRSLPLVAFVHRKLAAAGHLVATVGGYAPGNAAGNSALDEEICCARADFKRLRYPRPCGFHRGEAPRGHRPAVRNSGPTRFSGKCLAAASRA